MTRKPISDEARKKMSDSATKRDKSTRRGAVWTVERRAAQSARVKGTRYSPEVKEKMSRLKTEFWAKKRAEKGITNNTRISVDDL